MHNFEQFQNLYSDKFKKFFDSINNQIEDYKQSQLEIISKYTKIDLKNDA